MNKLCRGCLIANESFTYVLFRNVSADIYSFCTSIEVRQDDNLPKTLCNTCHDHLQNFSSFKRSCIQAQNTLEFQNNMKIPKEERLTNDSDVIYGGDGCYTVVNEIKINKVENLEYNEIEDFKNNLDNLKKELNEPIFNKNCDMDHHDTTITEDTGDDEPLQKLKKNRKCKIRKKKAVKDVKTIEKKKLKIFEYVCKLCKSKFKYKERYEAHRLEHQGQTVNKTCTVCKKVFNTWSGLQRHTDSEHKIVPMNTLLCKVCGKVFKNQQTLKLHTKSHQQTENHMCVCDVCGKSYASPVTLKFHLESHNENRARDFPCEHCGKKFFTKYILQSHIKRLHTGQRYICQICNYPFTDKYNLGKHVQQKHQGIKTHKCDICEKFFSTHSTLVIHKRIHSGERPYSCAYCAKAFSSKNRLVVHHRTHTGERPHRCAVCNLAFTQPGTMKRHMKTHNKLPSLPNVTENFQNSLA